jgi:alpha-1,3-rhamnosyl/mannosyltransferase
MSTIGVNLLWLVPGVVGGSEEYTLRLLRAVDKLRCNDLWLRLYGQQDLFDAHPDLMNRFEARVGPRAGSKAARVGLEHSWLAAVSRHDDLVHHAGGVVPAMRSCPTVVTIHDLQPLEMPDRFSPLKRRWLSLMLPASVRAARLIMCPSEFTAHSIATRLGAPSSKVEVVRHGHAQVEAGVLDHDTDRRLKDRYGRYLLLPGIAYAHKRHRDLILALDRLRHRFEDLSVVLTGTPGPESNALAVQAAELGLTPRVHVLGRVPEQELDDLYRSAAALVFPSEYEGFGNPVVEAMARGCPVITTNATALPEVVGDAGLVVPVGRPEALAAAVARVLTEPDLADELRAAGVERATQFSWEAAGSSLAECYRRAVRQAG